MSHELTSITHKPGGDTLEHIVTATDSDTEDEFKDLRGGDAEWALLTGNLREVLFTEEDDGFNVEITDGEGGEVMITIESEATAGLRGTHYQRLRLRDGSDRQRTYLGKIRFVNVGPDA